MTRQRRLKEERKERRAQTFAAIREMTDEQLKDLAHELGREKTKIGSAVAELNSRLDVVRNERERRATATTRGINISDHAVLRYLERVRGVDVAAAREEIAALAVKHRLDRHGDQYAREETSDGLIFGFNGVDKTITTIMTPRENDVLSTGDYLNGARPSTERSDG